MIDLKIKSGDLLSYDPEKDKVYLNGNTTKQWLPTFIPNGTEEPTFFGFVDTFQKICYDIYGGVSKIHDEDSIKL